MMSQQKNFVTFFSVLSFFLMYCRGLKVTGEICRYANGVVECKPEIISSSEKRKLLDMYEDKNCVFETYANELHIEDDLCPSKPVTANKPISIFMGIDKPTEMIEDVFASGISKWGDDEDLPTRHLELYSAEYEEDEEIEFHRRSAKNVIISSDLKTARRKVSPSTGFGTALTKGPLKPGQIFYVWVNYEKTPDMPWIGVTRYSPETIAYPEQMLQMIDGTWTWNTLANEIFKNGESLVKPFVQEDLNIQNGDRFGVSISDEGLIHFHHNGRDLGPADEGVQEEMWGFVDIHLPGTNVTIAS